MAELGLQEWLQPSLLDRLCDDEPKHKEESRDKRAISVQKLRASVLRDLAWLLNTSNLGEILDEEAFPEIGRSVLNYGVPPFAGEFVLGSDVGVLEAIMRDAVAAYEPRILPGTLNVKLSVNAGQHNNNAMTFDIEGSLWAKPVPVRIFLRTEVDLEIGHIRVVNASG